MINKFTKIRLVLIVALSHLLINISLAQAPQKMSYQAVIRNTSGALVTSSSVGMKISILQDSVAGTVVYAETQNASTNANGLVSVEIGSGTIIIGTFSGINWGNGPYFIKTQTDPTGGTNYTFASSSQLMSVPYALFSANGAPGPQGPQGIQGPQGQQGQAGATGPAGAQGCRQIGDYYAGGIVFYVDSSCQHGKVVTPFDLINYSFNSQQSDAISISNNVKVNGYTDWILPTIIELQQVYDNLGNGGFSVLNSSQYIANTYWSSTVASEFEHAGYAINFITGVQSIIGYKDCRIRAIRNF